MMKTKHLKYSVLVLLIALLQPYFAAASSTRYYAPTTHNVSRNVQAYACARIDPEFQQNKMTLTFRYNWPSDVYDSATGKTYFVDDKALGNLMKNAKSDPHVAIMCKNTSNVAKIYMKGKFYNSNKVAVSRHIVVYLSVVGEEARVSIGELDENTHMVVPYQP